MQNELEHFMIGRSYGGNQDWMQDAWMKLGGCAALDAVDSCLYFTLFRKMKGLCPIDARKLTKDSYRSFGMIMKPYISPRWRGAAAFVFTDGMGGAKAVKKQYPSAAEKTVISLDCVGAGDEILFLPSRYSRWNTEALDAILESFDGVAGEGKSCFLKTDGIVYYPAGNRAFRYSIAVCACDKLAGFGRIVRRARADQGLRGTVRRRPARREARLQPGGRGDVAHRPFRPEARDPAAQVDRARGEQGAGGEREDRKESAEPAHR